MGRGQRAVLSITDHHVFDGSFGWIASEADRHPTLRLTVAVDGDAYSRLDLPKPPRSSAVISAVADSGAQTCLRGMSVLSRLGLRKEHFTPVSKRILAANDEEVNVLGAIFVKMSGLGTQGQRIQTSAMVYVTESTNRFYVSKSALVQLGVLALTSRASAPRWRPPWPLGTTRSETPLSRRHADACDALSHPPARSACPSGRRLTTLP